MSTSLPSPLDKSYALAFAAGAACTIGLMLMARLFRAMRQRGGRKLHGRIFTGTSFLEKVRRLQCSNGGVRGLLAYNLESGVTIPEYDKWLFEQHYPDLFENPALKGITLHTVLPDKPTLSSGKKVDVDPATEFWRLAELHFDSLDDYRSYVSWFQQHSIPSQRSPTGRSAFRFYVLAGTQEIQRLEV